MIMYAYQCMGTQEILKISILHFERNYCVLPILLQFKTMYCLLLTFLNDEICFLSRGGGLQNQSLALVNSH